MSSSHYLYFEFFIWSAQVGYSASLQYGMKKRCFGSKGIAVLLKVFQQGLVHVLEAINSLEVLCELLGPSNHCREQVEAGSYNALCTHFV